MNTRNFAKHLVILTVLGVLAACGGGSSTPAPPVTVAAITAQPTDQSVVVGTAATFSVVASNASGYQWQSSTDGGASFADMAGESNATLTLPAVAQGDNGTQYRVVVSGAGNTVTSNAALLTVSAAPAPPAFTTQPVGVTITEGQNAQFTVAVSGAPTPTLQWQLSADGGVTWNNINGATSTILDLAGVALGNSGRQFRAVATNGSGSIDSNAAVLTVLPRTWGTGALIETDNGNALSPQIAFDANGNALAVWSQFDGARYNIVANRYTAGTGWGTAALIETDNAGDAYGPQIAIDPNGNALAVWSQFDGARYNIVANRYTFVTNNWGTAELIETDNAGSVYERAIAFDANGNALVVWSQSNGVRRNIMANRYTAATNSWGTAGLIETSDMGDATQPQVAFDANGNALAVWSQWDGQSVSILSNRYTAATGWGTAEPVETSNAGFAYDPQIAFDANGNALAVWGQDGDVDGAIFRYDIWSNRYNAATGWGTAALIETDNAGDAYQPQIAIDPNGNALAVWYQSDGTRTNIWFNRFIAGTGWGMAALIETDNAGDAYGPQIAFDPNGNALAVWSQFDGTRYNIVANRYTAGTGWGTAALIETDDVGGAFDHQIAIDANGNALAVWTQYDVTRSNIWANAFR